MQPIFALVKSVWFFTKPYQKQFWLATLYRICADLAWLYPPYAFALIVNFFGSYSNGLSLTPIYWALGLTSIAVAVRYLGIYFAKSSMFRLGEKITLDAEQRSVEHLMLLDISWHEKETSGGKFKRIERGANSIQKILRIWINNIIEIVINLIGIVLIIAQFDRGIAIAVAVFLVTYYVLAHYYRVRAVAESNIVNAKEEVRSGLVFEAINNIRSVKVMSMAEKIIDTLSVNARDLLVSIKKRIYWFQAGNSIRNVYAHLFRIGVVVFIIYGIVNGKYEVGFLVLFSGYFTTVWQSMSELTDVSEDFAVARIAVSRMQDILDTPVAIDIETDKVKFPSNWNTITLRQVSFSYQNEPVLNDISFEIKRGEKIGIVGLSGAGKSTLFKLLLKEHENYGGEILFDNQPLKDISKKNYFKNVAVVLQDTELFNTSLEGNITVTNPAEAHNSRLLIEAVQISHVWDFAVKLPSKLETIIGEKGIKLSGGEKQRVGIARAIFKNPQILLLDEATSHLDIESEKDIQESLGKFFQNVTAIVIAHRLTTIKEMDRILVMDQGKIVESGNFNKLQRMRGRFYELWQKQKL